MENPAAWGKAEYVVHEALEAAWVDTGANEYGISLARQVTDALRKAGLLKDDQ